MSVITFPFFKQSGDALNLQRRRLLAALGWGSVGVVCGASAVATLRFLYPRVLFEPPAYFTIGYPSAFAISEPADSHGVCLVLLKWKILVY